VPDCTLVDHGGSGGSIARFTHEIATDVPGFAIDEDEAHLGELLKLPDWAEKSRSQIEAALIPVTFQPENYV
jgi:glyoxalase family protein